MTLQIRHSPLNQVLGTLPLGLARNPYLKVLDAVVVLNAVLVMHVFKWFKKTTQVLLHKYAVLQSVSVPSFLSEVADKVALRIWMPTALCYRDSFAAAIVRAVLGFLGWHPEKFFAAEGARKTLGPPLCFGDSLALLRAVDPSLKVTRLGRECLSAVGAIFQHGGNSLWNVERHCTAFPNK